MESHATPNSQAPAAAPRRRHAVVHRDLIAPRYLDLFLVTGVTAVLVIRFILWMTNYPSVGGAKYHIAHLLWGGLLMAAAILISVTLLGHRSRTSAAIIGGIGFGLFIDEVGKFVTRDNNYFFQPAVALIYIAFLLIFFAVRDLELAPPITRAEYLVNAIQDLLEAVINDLKPEERDRALAYLQKVEAPDELTAGLRTLIAHAECVRGRPDRILRRISRLVAGLHDSLLHRTHRSGGLDLLFLSQVGVNGLAIAAVTWPALDRSFSTWMLLGSFLLAAVLAVIAALIVRRSRMKALQWFHRSLLVSIFVTQVFVFYRNPVIALLLLVFNFLCWISLSVLVSREARAERIRAHAAVTGSAGGSSG